MEENFLKPWEKLIMKPHQEELKWIATTMRRIWLLRNALIFENQFASSRMVVQATREGLGEFHQAQNTAKEKQNTNVTATEMTKRKKTKIKCS